MSKPRIAEIPTSVRLTVQANTSDDGQTRLHLRVETEMIWLSQLEIAELFQTTKQNVSLHAKNIFEDNELAPETTIKKSLTAQPEGGRQVKRKITYYKH
ncbi:MAG: hypothetical protein CML16_11170 [Pusillimonas sp.]|nr:hypothetical protein [Pusillimonas sp.]MBC40673.1 hypothetical protein [Pusillimonas sp.]